MADGKSITEKLADGFKDLTASSGSTVKALEQVNEAVLNSGRGMNGLSEAIRQSGNTLEQLSSGLGKIVGAVPGLGMVGSAIEGLGSIIGTTNDVASLLNQTFVNSVKGVDALSAVNRQLTQDNFSLAAQFGKSLAEAEKFTEFMIRSSEELSSADFGSQNMATESRKMIAALSQSKISFDQMQESIQNTEKNMNLYSAAVLQAQALGLDYSKYASIMGDMIVGQGMSVQDAAEALSMYGNLAGETGLTVGKISESLTGLGNSFKKMGLDATFGESFLRGFSIALKDTGIGLDSVADMTQTFGSRMASLSTNYGSAFITALKGGMDLGSGGALGAGIQMQAKLMDKNTDQAQLGAEIASAVRDTLASFTGGDIVTVTEAAQSKDPRMEQVYYMQTKMLDSIYGISDSNEQARTLELLQQMAEAQTTGDSQAMESIGNDLREAIGARSSTLSNEEKLNTMIAAQLGQLQEHTNLLRLIARVGNETLVTPMAETTDAALSSLFSNIPAIEKQLEQYAKDVSSGQSETILGAAINSGQSPLIRNLADYDKGLGAGKNDSEQLYDWIKGGNSITVESKQIVDAIKELGATIMEMSPKDRPNGSVGTTAAGTIGRKG